MRLLGLLARVEKERSRASLVAAALMDGVQPAGSSAEAAVCAMRMTSQVVAAVGAGSAILPLVAARLQLAAGDAASFPDNLSNSSLVFLVLSPLVAATVRPHP